MKQVIHLYKALSDETRLRLLALLGQGELCVCDLVAVLRLPQSTVSRHLALLKGAGWVTDRRQGVWMFYRLAGEGMPLRLSLERAILDHLAALEVVNQDRERLVRYLASKGQEACG